MAFTHVIFDLDGTLLNTLDDLTAAGNHMCELHGWPTFTADEFRFKVGNGQPKLIERLIPAEFAGDGRIFEQALSEFRTYYSAHKQDRTAPYSGIMEMLDALLDAGVTLGVLSNKDHAATTPKPAAPITLHVLELLSADPASTLYVGDSNVDIACGHNAGLRSCGVAWGFRGRAELEAAGADYVIDDPRELIDIVL